MDEKPDKPELSDSEPLEYIEVIDDGTGIITWPPPPPITREDLLRIFEKDYSEEDATQLANDLTPRGPGEIWGPDLLLDVAALSPEHEARMREYLGLTAEQMAAALLEHRSRQR